MCADATPHVILQNLVELVRAHQLLTDANLAVGLDFHDAFLKGLCLC